jgi:hypothetical protein
MALQLVLLPLAGQQLLWASNCSCFSLSPSRGLYRQRILLVQREGAAWLRLRLLCETVAALVELKLEFVLTQALSVI